MVTEIRQIMAQTYITTFCEPMDANYRRIQYTRYADDFLIGVIGSKADCEAIKADITEFMSENSVLNYHRKKL